MPVIAGGLSPHVLCSVALVAAFFLGKARLASIERLSRRLPLALFQEPERGII
jgi:hypothetical protein